MVSKIEKILALDVDSASKAEMIDLIKETGAVIFHHNGCVGAYYVDPKLGLIGVQPSQGCEKEASFSSMHAIKAALKDLQQEVRRKTING